MAINERGIWLSRDETDTHEFDKKLCVAIIKRIKGHKLVVDLGCGNGSYTREMRKAGFICSGYDGSPLTPVLTNGECKIVDLSKPLDIGKVDVALCLEVGEHIPVEYEQVFIDNICNTKAKMIILSWGVEGQGGTGHVNCRNNDYVISEMFKRGFSYNPKASDFLRENSELPWFKDTLMVYEPARSNK